MIENTLCSWNGFPTAVMNPNHNRFHFLRELKLNILLHKLRQWPIRYLKPPSTYEGTKHTRSNNQQIRTHTSAPSPRSHLRPRHCHFPLQGNLTIASNPRRTQKGQFRGRPQTSSNSLIEQERAPGVRNGATGHGDRSGHGAPTTMLAWERLWNHLVRRRRRRSWMQRKWQQFFAFQLPWIRRRTPVPFPSLHRNPFSCKLRKTPNSDTKP